MQRRFQKPVSPVVLLSVAMVIGMGMAAEASAGPVMFCPRNTLGQGSDGERDTMSRWLTTFSNSLRTLHSHGVAIATPPRPSLAFRLVLQGPALEQDATVGEPRRQVQAHLIDLPPPAL